MWKWLIQNGSHAIAPVFRHRPEHPVKDCEYCALRMKDKVNHIPLHVPLEYQHDTLSQTTVTRFAVVVNRAPTVDSSAYGKSLLDVWRNEFQCRINRVLDVHQIHSIQPSRDNVQSELEALCAAFKIGDRLLLYWHDEDNEAERQDPISVLHSRRKDVYVMVWLLCTHPIAVAHPLLTCTYTDTQSSRASVAASDEGKMRIYVMAPASEAHRARFTARWLDVMQRHRYRLSVARLLQELQGTAVFRSNFPVNPRTLHFGFG